MIKAVVFDMDGTLFDTESVYAMAWREAGRELGLPSDRVEAAVAACTGRNTKDTQEYFAQNMADIVTYDDFIAARTRHYDAEIERRGGIPKKAGLDELFAYLKQNGYKMALATATRRERTLDNLTKTGILDYFDALVTGDIVSHGKPHPETFLTAARMLGVKPNECMGVEDSFNGVRSIHAAGMLTVMIPDTVMPTPEIEALLDVKCKSLKDIIPLLQEIGQNGIH